MDKLEIAYLKTLESNLKMAQESAKYYKDKVAPLEEMIKLLILENTQLRKEENKQIDLEPSIRFFQDDADIGKPFFGGPDDDDYDDSINWGHDSDDEC